MKPPPVRFSSCSHALLVAAFVTGCGGGSASPDAGLLPPTIGEPVALDVMSGYNHNSETSIAVVGNRVVVTSINQLLADADTFMPGPSTGFRRSAVYLSTDNAQTFTNPVALDDQLDDTTDPVVRAADGVFWIATIDAGSGGALVWSGDGSRNEWQLRARDIPVRDKHWLALDADGSQIYLLGAGGIFALDADGTVLEQVEFDSMTVNRNAVSGYVDSERTAHFLTFDPDVLSWDGTADPTLFDLPAFDDEWANVWTRSAGAIGETLDGSQWVVRADRSGTGATVSVLLKSAGMVTAESKLLTPLDGVSFLPAAAIDEEGILHVVWYDTNGPAGRLVYSRSAGSNLLGDYTDPVVVDGDACPGERWHPYPTSPLSAPGGRRLREYIDIAVDGGRVFVAWTHAPTAPSTVYVATIDPAPEPED